jgi:putative tricarboxylic transport membrane protein
MLASLGQFGSAFGDLLTLGTMFTVFWAMFIGIVIGALPGLTATMGVALLRSAIARISRFGRPCARA